MRVVFEPADGLATLKSVESSVVVGGQFMSNIMPLRALEPASAIVSGTRAATSAPGLASGVGAPKLGATGPRLMDMMLDPSPERMAHQLQSFRVSVQDSLAVSSKAYRLLSELENAGLAECVPCTEQLRQTLAINPHFVVLKKLEEAERLLSGLGQTPQ